MTTAASQSTQNTPRRYRPYPQYKDSGIEWLGEVPAGWPTKRLKYCVRLCNEKADGQAAELPYTGLEHIESWTGRRIIPSEGTEADGEVNTFRPGDVLFGKLRPYLAKVYRAREDGVCTGELLVLRPIQVDQGFLFYIMLSREFVSVVDSSTYGAKMPRASWDFIGSLPVPVPSADEQRAIAAFLDRETARIDALIEKKCRQIELLQEKRAALISHAVTKGLDPNVPMKDSGVEWLGEIPEHWEVKGLKRLTTLRAGAAITAGSIEEIGEFPVFGGNGIRGYTSSYTHEGDFPLIGRQGALCGCVNFASGRFWASEHAVVAMPQAEVDTYWLAYLLRAMSLNSYSESAAQPGLAVETISALHVPAPILPEQRAIAAFLDRETARIDALVEKIKTSIDLLREYRTALISAAVTGKIDVSKEVA